jgi:hypothetical protein
MEGFVPSQDPGQYDIPLMNQPPQIFGNFGTDEDLVATYDANFFGDDHGGSVDENNDAKRRRIARVRLPPFLILGR